MEIRHSSLPDIPGDAFRVVAGGVTLYKQKILYLEKSYERIVSNVDMQGIDLHGVVSIGGVPFSVVKHIDKDCWEVVSMIVSYDRKTIPAETRREVMERDNHICQVCGSTSRLRIDHIIPWSQGSDDSIDNLQVLCESCNLIKGDGQLTKSPIDLKPSRVKTVYKPDMHLVPEHIEVYLKSFQLLVPTSCIRMGKGTICSVLGVLIVRKSYRK